MSNTPWGAFSLCSYAAERFGCCSLDLRAVTSCMLWIVAQIVTPFCPRHACCSSKRSILAILGLSLSIPSLLVGCSNQLNYYIFHLGCAFLLASLSHLDGLNLFHYEKGSIPCQALNWWAHIILRAAFSGEWDEQCWSYLSFFVLWSAKEVGERRTQILSPRTWQLWSETIWATGVVFGVAFCRHTFDLCSWY